MEFQYILGLWTKYNRNQYWSWARPFRIQLNFSQIVNNKCFISSKEKSHEISNYVQYIRQPKKEKN